LTSAGEPRATGRQRGLIQGSEILLYALIEARGEGAQVPALDLRREFVNLRFQEEEMRKRQEELPMELRKQREELRERQEAAAEREEILQALDRSRGFALLRGWWRLCQRLRASAGTRARSTTHE
jgi:hypothetical protein